MMKSRNRKHRLDPLTLLALLLALGVMTTSTVSAAESFLSKPELSDLQDGDITLAGAEHGGAGLHMSFMSPSELYSNSESDYVVTSDTGVLPDVYLSLRLSW